MSKLSARRYRWVIIVIFIVGLGLSAGTFLLQYYGYCPMGTAVPGYWTYAVPSRVAAKREDQGLPDEIVSRLRSYDNVNDIPHQAEIVDSFTEDGECLICQEAMQSQKISQLPCGHIYHKGCVSNWLKVKSTCPSCRMIITEENLNGIPQIHLQEAPDIELGMVKPVTVPS